MFLTRSQVYFHLALSLFLCFPPLASALQTVDEFINYMAETHEKDPGALSELLGRAKVSDSILEAISRPAEGKKWRQYRPIFVTPERIKRGVEFWQEHASALRDAEARFGVPAEIMVAIIGVETFYGRHTGRYRVLDALFTLGFHYPKRADFFRGELEQFLLLVDEEKVAPESLTGSYAGAMGMPQFISSSFRAYAVDFDGDGKRNIWSSTRDAIGSVGNYLAVHGWQGGGPIVSRAHGEDGAALSELVDKKLKPSRSVRDFPGVRALEDIDASEAATLMALEAVDGTEYWFGFKNFYVITRYNHSAKYAMAVVQLAQAVRAAHSGETGK